MSICLFIFQVVLLSGHLDSWDVGQGAMDDGGGVAISWEALSLIKDLGKYLLENYCNPGTPDRILSSYLIILCTLLNCKFTLSASLHVSLFKSLKKCNSIFYHELMEELCCM